MECTNDATQVRARVKCPARSLRLVPVPPHHIHRRRCLVRQACLQVLFLGWAVPLCRHLLFLQVLSTRPNSRPLAHGSRRKYDRCRLSNNTPTVFGRCRRPLG